MKNIVKYDLKKMKNSKFFYVCSLLVLLLTWITVESQYTYISCMKEGVVAVVANAGIEMVLAVAVPLFICDDFENGAVRLILGRGYTREKYWIGKYCSAILLTCYLFLLTVFGTMVFLNLKGCEGSITFGSIENLIAQWLLMLVLVSLFVMFSMLFKKKAGAIAIGVLLPSVVALVLSGIDIISHMKYELNAFWVSSFLIKLGDVGISDISRMKIVLASIIYIAVFDVVSYGVVRKIDL